MKCFIKSSSKEAIHSDVVEFIYTLGSIQGISDNGDLVIVEVLREDLSKLEEYCSAHGLELEKTLGFSF